MPDSPMYDNALRTFEVALLRLGRLPSTENASYFSKRVPLIAVIESLEAAE